MQNLKHFLTEHGKKYDRMTVFRFPYASPGKCYANAYFVVLCADIPLSYVQGIVSVTHNGKPTHVEHAWVVDKKGQGFEVTWSQPGFDYIGIEVPLKTLERYQKRYGGFGIYDLAQIQKSVTT